MNEKELFTVKRIGGSSNGTGGKIQWTDEQIKYCIQDYNINNNVKSLAKKFSVSQQAMSSLLKRNGVNVLLTCEKAKITNPRNSLFFHKIDSPEKAYWLGFLYADGYVNEKTHSIRINLQKKDEEHLRKFLLAIEANNTPIKHSKKETEDKIYEGSYIAFGDKQMVTDLVSKGCVQNKSLILKFPSEKIVPHNLLHHFVRGYFDGDGTIWYAIKPPNNLKYFNFGLLGTKDFLQGVQNFLNKASLKLEDKETHCSLNICGNRNIENIFSILYKDSHESIELTRKREKFDELILQRATIKTYSTK